MSLVERDLQTMRSAADLQHIWMRSPHEPNRTVLASNSFGYKILLTIHIRFFLHRCSLVGGAVKSVSVFIVAYSPVSQVSVKALQSRRSIHLRHAIPDRRSEKPEVGWAA